MTTSLLNKPFFSFFLHILFLLLHIFSSSSFFALAEHTSSTTSPFGNNNTEAEALLQWKASLDNQSQSLLSSWVGISPCINWIGITCGNYGSVTNLTLESFGLRGTLDDFNFSAFRNLFVLDLANNSLSGTIPHEIGKLKNLFFLDLYENQLYGSNPQEIGLLESLNQLDLGSNVLTGKTPYSIGNLRNLYFLALSMNQLSGPIPSSIGNLTSLSNLYLWSNKLFGSIPSSIGNLTMLIQVSLQQNNLIGLIPFSVGNLTSLSILYLWGNKLSGSIPQEIGLLESLNELDLENIIFNGAGKYNGVPKQQSILVIGATGFLAKIFVEKILRVRPKVKKLYLLLRAVDTKSAEERLYDVALGINTLGPLLLLNFVKKCNNVKVLVHLSTDKDMLFWVFHLAINTGLFQKPYKDKYTALDRKLKRGMRLAKLYEPYVFFKAIFDDTNSEKLQIAGTETCSEANAFNFDPTSVNWEAYMMDVHFLVS
nr:probable leucine-rich repeat receptor-like protein kinase At2g33170 [Populus alba]